MARGPPRLSICFLQPGRRGNGETSNISMCTPDENSPVCISILFLYVFSDTAPNLLLKTEAEVAKFWEIYMTHIMPHIYTYTHMHTRAQTSTRTPTDTHVISSAREMRHLPMTSLPQS